MLMVIIIGITFQITRTTFQITRTTFQIISNNVSNNKNNVSNNKNNVSNNKIRFISQKHLQQQRRSQQLISPWEHPVQEVVEILATAVPEVGTAEDDNEMYFN